MAESSPAMPEGTSSSPNPASSASVSPPADAAPTSTALHVAPPGPPSQTTAAGPPPQMAGNLPPPMRPPFQGPPRMGMMMAPPPRMGPGPGMMMPPGGPASVGMPTPPMGSVMMPPPNMPPAPGPGGPMPGPGILGPRPSPGGPMPSPIVDKNGEMWLEHKSPDGRVYYSNVRTRQTSWSKPEPADPNKPPPPVPAGPSPGTPMMAPSGGPPPGVPGAPPPGIPGGPPPSMPGGPPPGMMPPPPGPNGPPMNMPLMGMPPMRPPMMGGPPPMMGGPPPMGPMGMMPPPGGPPMMGRPPFPMGGPPGGMMMPMQNAQGRVWSEHKHPDGRTYYYNRLTTKSEWKKPDDFETAMAPLGPIAIPPAAAKITDEKKESPEEKKEDGDKKEEEVSEEKMDTDEKEEEKPVEPTRPIATKPVPGRAPWVIVFTSDDRVFFFNQANSQSIWSIPEELADVEHLEDMMKTPRQRAEDEAARRKADRDAETGAVKRPADSVGEPQAKKPVVEDPNEDGLTTEQRAQRLRNMLTLEERQQQFKAMLAEKKVSAFSTWEKELNKLVYDPRYLLLSTKERKSAFDQYLRTRAEEERKERKDQHLGKKSEYKALLAEALVGSKYTSFSDFAMKYGRDKRFKAIEKMRERESMFSEYVDEEKHRQRKRQQEEMSGIEKVENEFMEMLKEDKSLTARSHWRRVKDDFSDDDRYIAVESSERREELFKKFRQVLIEAKEAEERREREREERIAASIKARTREVEQARSEQQREVQLGRSHHIKEEAEQALKALLADLVRDSSMDWSTASSLMRRDHRWNSLDVLASDKKEDIFSAHCADLRQRKRTMYNRLLNDIPGLNLGTTWKEVKKIIRSDSKYEKLANDARRKEEYQRFMREKTSSALESYKQLLKETRLITHKSLSQWRESESYRKEVLSQLEKDNRHLIMDSISDERESMLELYMKDLRDRGPPPPPTASESSARYKPSRRH